MSKSTSPALTIGALARASGIPTNTLRTWQRRYGFPPSERTDGGHRLYEPELVDHLLLLRQALDRGHRPAQIMVLDRDQVASLIGETDRTTVASGRGGPPDLMALTRSLDGAGLERHMTERVATLGYLPFLTDHVAPFLEALGEGWASGDIEVYQEHFATERLASFLGGRWRGLAAPTSGPHAVLATLPTEHHVVGLHMAAIVFALAGWQLDFLGGNTPVQDIVRCVEQVDGRAVALSVSRHADAARVAAQVDTLRRLLPGSVDLVVGGAGALDVEGVLGFDDLGDLARWAAGRKAPMPSENQ